MKTLLSFPRPVLPGELHMTVFFSVFPDVVPLWREQEEETVEIEEESMGLLVAGGRL